MANSPTLPSVELGKMVDRGPWTVADVIILVGYVNMGKVGSRHDMRKGYLRHPRLGRVPYPR